MQLGWVGLGGLCPDVKESNSHVGRRSLFSDGLICKRQNKQFQLQRTVAAQRSGCFAVINCFETAHCLLDDGACSVFWA